MASTVISITSPDSTRYEASTYRPRLLKEVADLLRRAASGQSNAGQVQVNVITGAVPASGTITPGTVVATNACTVNGQTFTAVASNPTANQFLAGVATIAGPDLARAINASTATKNAVLATVSAAGVVTITALAAGEAGNRIALASGTNLTASGTFLTAGAGTASAFSL